MKGIDEGSSYNSNAFVNKGYDTTSDDHNDPVTNIMTTHPEESCKDREFLNLKEETAPSESSSLTSNNRTKYLGTFCCPSRLKGKIYALFSTMMLSICSMLVVLVGESVSSNQIVFNQMYMQLLFSIPLLTLQKASFQYPKEAWVLIVLRSVIGSTVTCLVFFAYQVMPVASAKAILYSAPIFTGLFSCVLLSDACTVFDVIFSLTTIGGVFLVIQPPFLFGGEESSSSFLGPTFCLISAVLIGTIYISLRKIAAYRVHPLVQLVTLCIVGITVSGSMTTGLGDWVIPPCGRSRIFLICNSLFSFASQVTFVISMRYETATTVSLIRTTDVFFTFILDFLIFGTVPNGFTISGAFIIVGSLVGLTAGQWWTEKRRLRNQEDDKQSNNNFSIPNDTQSIETTQEL
ncbi:solute carrier family 35 member G1-like [Diadema antillarum]|uniref:solute carrier family 35 member G1-like n=1 Tax=Diadema antillarum TaxID=105358 RepID=UPI003A83A889